MLEVTLGIVGGFVLATFSISFFSWVKSKSYNVKGKHILITGGSSGLGLALGIKFAKMGANISILARSQKRLDEAKQQIISSSPNSKVFIQSCDATNEKSVMEFVENANNYHGQTCDILVCSAGCAKPGYFAAQSINIFQEQMDVNYFGTLIPIKVVSEDMIKSNRKSSVVLVSSAAALCGMIGYTQYCPSKFAVRGLADCLRNEFIKYNISVHIFYPANMQTPGFEEEEKTKPQETRDIEGTSPTQSPEDAADCLINGLKRGRYAITNDFLCELLRMGTCTIGPRTNTLFEVILLPFVGLLGRVFTFHFDRVVRKSIKKNKNDQILDQNTLRSDVV